MLLLSSILSFALAFTCLKLERRPDLWYLDRWLLAPSGFWFALGAVAAVGFFRSL